MAKLDAEIASLEDQSAKLRKVAPGAFDSWLAARPKSGDCPDFCRSKNGTVPFAAAEVARYSFDERKGDQLPNSVKGGKPAVIHGENKLVPGKFGRAVQFSGGDQVDLPLGNYQPRPAI